MSIFKAYDIRGVVPDEMGADDAYRIGRAVARWLGGAELAVGRDARRSSPELAEALLRGINDEGVSVIDIGLVSTPMLYFAVEELALAGGVMITASHNPGHYNGLKVCREHAIPVGGDSGLQEIEQLAATATGSAHAPRGSVRSADVRDGYVRHALSVGGRCPRLRVAIDCGNGVRWGSSGCPSCLKSNALPARRHLSESRS
jgi:phosphomannomutase